MKALITGVSMIPYDIAAANGRPAAQGVSCKVSLAKGRAAGGEGRRGFEAGIYTTDDATATMLSRAFVEMGGPYVADVDFDIKGQKENKQAIICGAEVIGPLSEFTYSKDGLTFKSASGPQQMLRPQNGATQPAAAPARV